MSLRFPKNLEYLSISTWGARVEHHNLSPDRSLEGVDTHYPWLFQQLMSECPKLWKFEIVTSLGAVAWQKDDITASQGPDSASE